MTTTEQIICTLIMTFACIGVVTTLFKLFKLIEKKFATPKYQVVRRGSLYSVRRNDLSDPCYLEVTTNDSYFWNEDFSYFSKCWGSLEQAIQGYEKLIRIQDAEKVVDLEALQDEYSREDL